MSGEMMKMYNEAYETLSDPEKRLNYDVSIGLRPTEPEPKPAAAQPYPGYFMPTEKDWKDWNEAEYQSYSVIGLEKILAYLLTPIGAIMLLYFAYFAVVAKSAINWPTVDGHIVNSKVGVSREYRRMNHAEGDYYAQIYYEYKVEGLTYKDWENIGWYQTKEDAYRSLDSYVAQYAERALKVHYKPGNPERSIIDAKTASRSPVSYAPTTYFVSGTFLFCIGFVCILDILGLARFDVLEYIKEKLRRKQKAETVHNHQSQRSRNKPGSFFGRGKLPRR